MVVISDILILQSILELSSDAFFVVDMPFLLSYFIVLQIMMVTMMMSFYPNKPVSRYYLKGGQ